MFSRNENYNRHAFYTLTQIAECNWIFELPNYKTSFAAI